MKKIHFKVHSCNAVTEKKCTHVSPILHIKLYTLYFVYAKKGVIIIA